MDIRKVVATAGVMALAAGALPASALTVGSGTLSKVTGAVNTAVQLGANGSDSGSNTAGSAHAGVGVGTSVHGSTSRSSTTSDTSVTGGVHTTVDTEAHAVSNGSSDSGNALLITRADLDAATAVGTWDSSRTAVDVKSSSDLKAYVASELKSDENISAVEANSSDVAITYKQRGRFLGFIPVTLDATATVDANGHVTVSYPWYSFLTTTDRADLQAKLQASVDAMMNNSASAQTAGMSSTTPNAKAIARANANASFKFTSDAQARIVAEMRRILNEELNASADANASASSNLQ